MSKVNVAPAPGIRDCAAYFEEYLPTLLGKRLVDGLAGLDCVFEIAMMNRQETGWRLTVSDGRLAEVREANNTGQCRFLVSEEGLRKIIRGEVTPADAFLDLQVEIEGDVELGLRLSMVLEPFFQRFPYTV